MTWKQMTSIERDAWVAEYVMGRRFWAERRGGYELAVMDVHLVGYPDGTWHEPWKRSRPGTEERYREIDCCEASRMGFHGQGPPRYTTDPAADYLVLKHIRETWSDTQKRAFGNEMACYVTEGREHHGRTEDFWMSYRPGDYSHAAYRTTQLLTFHKYQT